MEAGTTDTSEDCFTSVPERPPADSSCLSCDDLPDETADDEDTRHEGTSDSEFCELASSQFSEQEAPKHRQLSVYQPPASASEEEAKNGRVPDLKANQILELNPALKYKVLAKIGEGSFGTVFRARVLLGPHKGSTVVLKRITLDAQDDGVPSNIIREISLLKELSHRYIVQLYDVFPGGKEIYLVFESLEQDLKQYIHDHEALNIQLVKRFMYQLFKAIHYCHTRRVLHRDLKPQNLLVDVRRQIIKLADFGLARAFGVASRVYTQVVVTLWYRGPEILLGVKNYTMAVDIWSLACIFAEMMLARVLFRGENETDQLYRIFRTLGTPTERTWPGCSSLPNFKSTFQLWPPQALKFVMPKVPEDALDLLQDMLRYDVLKRISAKNALQHRFFDDLPEKDLL
eukprot:m.102441 g.102441  ORF g.102441 m.102441 type:complete len:401 (+) comp51539_c0_seq10:64-1266(+)